ncbi:hypothetical protein VP424E501_P0164 [Vibrio phage 424E50-1]|nr:hypothetical protein VP424E501_P0164 [Vibrio phage 424E50-1]
MVQRSGCNKCNKYFSIRKYKGSLKLIYRNETGNCKGGETLCRRCCNLLILDQIF